MADTKSEPKNKREDEIDQRAAGQFDLANREQQVGEGYVDAGQDRLDAYLRDKAENNNGNLGSVAREAEQAANPMNFTGGKSEKRRTLRTAFARITGRKAATGGVIGLLFGGILGFGVLLSPSIGIIHMAETFMNDLDDSVAALDRTHFKLLRAQTNDMGKPVSSCTLVKFRCGLKGMSDRQIAQYKKAGIDIEVGEKNNVTRKSPVKSMTFTKSDGTKVKVTNSRELRKLIGDKSVSAQIRRAYNPHFYSVADKLSSLTLRKLGLSRENKFTADSEEENRRAYADATSGDKTGVEADQRSGSDNPDEDRVAQEENAEKQKILDRLKGQLGASSLLKASLKGIAITGAADSACTVYGLSRGVEAGAKIIRADQLMGYSSAFLAYANAQKAEGTTPASTEMWGNILTATDQNKTIVNETSKDVNDEVPNPYYEKNAFDSEGYRTAAYNDAPELTARAQNMMVGGSMVGTLSVLNEAIREKINPETACPFVQNWFVRGGSLIIGVLAGIGTGGTTVALSVGASLAISLGGRILAAYLEDMIAGTTVNEETEGVDSGNALFAGTSAMLGSLSLARGMKPGNISELRKYLTKSDEIKSDIAAMEQERARGTPFDINNQYSFLGSLARSAIPSTSKLSMASFSPGQFLASIPSMLTPKASAALGFNELRFQKCNDTAYSQMGIDADVFCNIRYVFPEAEMGADIETVYEYMWEGDYVDEGGEPIDGTLYDTWIKECTERGIPLGVDPNEDVGKKIGKVCVDGKEVDGTRLFTREQLKNFRVYHMTRTVEDGLENGPEFNPLGPEGNASGTVNVATFNLRGASHTGGVFKDRMDLSIKVIEAGDFDIIGLQEFERSQREYFYNKKGDVYANYPEGTNNAGFRLSNSIAYRKDRFEVVKSKSGTVPGLQYFNGIDLDAPYVMLREISSGGEFYVINTHDPAFAENAKRRVDNAKQYVNFIENTLLRSNPDIPVILTGDFNSGYTVRTDGGNVTYQKIPENISYCIITKSPQIIEAYDSSSGRPEKCPNPLPKHDPIDQIYMTANIKASDWTRIERGYNNNGSDHPTISSTLTIPGLGSETAGSGEWSWPVDEKYWKSNRADFLDPHFANSGTWTSGVRSLAVDISSPGAGPPVYAMFSGQVTRGDLGGHGLLITSDIQGGKLQIAYAHGPRANNNNTYNAGDKIMTVGCLGNCSGPHLHIDMAFNGKGVCPQDVFLAFDKGQIPDFNQLTKKGIAPCGRL
jgi:endonuclease/exonuclease/phosphatase family metal-dependent hydrolase